MENIIIQSSHHSFCFLSHRARSRRQTMTKASTVTEAVVAIVHGCSESSWSAILGDSRHERLLWDDRLAAGRTRPL